MKELYCVPAVPMKRPPQIITLVLLHFLGAGVFAFIALVLFGVMGEATSGTTFNTDIAQGAKPAIAGVSLFLGVCFLFGAAIWVFVGFSLWRLKNWARI